MGEGRHKLNGGWGPQVPATAMAQETPPQERALTLPHGTRSGLQDLALQANAWHSGRSHPGPDPGLSTLCG